jgi:PAS domain S-box-containing protein
LHRLGTALVVAVVLALVASAWAVFGVRKSAANLTQLINEDVVTLSSMHELAIQVEAGARHARTLILSGDEIFAQRLAEVRAGIAEEMHVLERRLTSDEQRRLIARGYVLRDRIYVEMDTAAATMRAGDPHGAAGIVLERVEPLRAELGDLLANLIKDKKAELVRRSAAQVRASDQTMQLTALFGGVSLLCAAILAVLLRRAMRRESASELRLRHIFQGAAVAILEVDVSKVDFALKAADLDGLSDLRGHLAAHPDLLRKLVALLEVRGSNPAMGALIALPTGEQLRSLDRFFSTETLPIFAEVLSALHAGEPQFQSETVVLSATGERIEALLTVSFPEDLQHEPVVITLTDIGARKREERRSRQALEQSEARLRAVFDKCPLGITMSDVEGKLVYMNPPARDILAPKNDPLGTSALELVTDEDRARTAQWRDDFLHGRTEVSELRVDIHTKTGAVRTLRIKANLLREGEQVRGVVSTVEDITEWLRLEEELRQAQKMDAVGKLAGGVAHDFNNLLTVILNGVDLLRAEASKAQLEPLGQVEAAAERAASLTAQLLAFGRKQVIRQRVVDLNELVSNHCRMLHRLVGENIELCTSLEPGGAPAEVDPNLIELLLMNLVLNARDAMPFGGQIEIQLESMVAEAERGGAVVHLSVRDSGTGIDQEHLPHVFEPFFTTKTVGKGTGLGLATVYSIVEQHSGRIEVDTVLGKGTTFHVYLRRASASAVPWTEPVGGTPDGHETLLLVEDESAVRQMVSTSLMRCGYRVIEAANGDRALELWKKHASEIDLLLTDMVMPGSLSGRDLAVRLRGERPQLKVVYMSGYSAHGLADEPWSILVQKPFQLSTLAQVLRARLDEKEPSMRSRPLAVDAPARQRVFQV